jgi:hypothetical protein
LFLFLRAKFANVTFNLLECLHGFLLAQISGGFNLAFWRWRLARELLGFAVLPDRNTRADSRATTSAPGNTPSGKPRRNCAR